MDLAARQDPIIAMTSNCGNVTDSYKNVWNNYDISIADEKHAVLEWLSPLEPRERHQAIGMGRATGVGDKFLLTDEFTQWNQDSDGTTKPVLFCYGGPGVGKTYLSSLVIDKLICQVDAGDMAVACVYCDFHAQNEQSATGLLGALLKQIVGALESIPDEVHKAFENSKVGINGRRPLLPDILTMLIGCLSHLRRASICIDALDEFPVKHRPELWDFLQQAVRKCPNVRLFLTGRLHIRDEVQKYFPEMAEMLPISPSEHDIGSYLKMRLGNDPELDAMNEELEADILRIIPEVASEIFLLASLNMDVILAEATIHQRRRALDGMIKGISLRDAYDATFDRISRQDGKKSKLGMEALMWVSHSERPLNIVELRHALGVELGVEDFNIQNVPSIHAILGCTLGLVAIDEKASTVRLLHFTLQEYLLQRPTLFATAHSMMAEICLTYLNSQSIRELRDKLVINPRTASLCTYLTYKTYLGDILMVAPFLEYTTCFWGNHAAREMTEPVKSQALRFLDGYENHASAAVLWGKKLDEGRITSEISGLHCIAFWGIAEIAIDLLKLEERDVNGWDSSGRTPLMWAIKYKNRGMVEILLEQEDIEPDWKDAYGQTALSLASQSGEEDIVKLLLKRGDVDPNAPDKFGLTPLLLTIQPLGHCDLPHSATGHESVIKLLLERGDVDPNAPDRDGRTPLSFAAGTGWEGVVKLLLQQGDVDPNALNFAGLTPLSFAAKSGEQGAVKLLLERGDIIPDSTGSNGRTPLSWAAQSGQEGVARLLLERRDVDPNSRDCKGRKPLAFAAQWGREGVLKLFLERGDVDPNSRGNGQTPLSLAVLRGRRGVVKLLLQHKGVDPDAPDSMGRTPLSWAVDKGEGGLAKLLLERRDVNPNSPDRNGRTPLSFAAEKGMPHAVGLLLEHKDINPDTADNNGRTPLSFAAEGGRVIHWGHEYVVKLLLEREDVDPDSTDSKGQSALTYATMKGIKRIVRLLSDSKTRHCKSLETRDRIQTSVTDNSASVKEVTHPPATPGPVTLHTGNDPPKRKRRGRQSRYKRRKENSMGKRDAGSEERSKEEVGESEGPRGAS